MGNSPEHRQPWLDKWGIGLLLLWLIVWFIVSCTNVYGQNSKGIIVGQEVPDLSIGKLLNYPTKSAKISDFKGKILILDFWATWCSGCIQYFPIEEQLEEKYAGKLQVIGVTYEPQSKIEHFFSTHRDTKGNAYTIASVVEDSVLTRLFPHRSVPHCVWIVDGVVRAITGAEEITTANIDQMLRGVKTDLDQIHDIDVNKPLFLSDYINPNNLQYYSILLKKHIAGPGSGTSLRLSGDTVRGISFRNSMLLDLYESAVRPIFEANSEIYSAKRSVLDVADTALIKLTKGENGIYRNDHDVNYDLIVPSSKADSLYVMMLCDLNRYSGFTGTVLERKQKCLVLIRSGKLENLSTKGGQAVNTLFYKTPAVFKNLPLKFFVNRLNGDERISLPVIDETNFKGNADISLTGFTTLEQLRVELRAYGLDLVEKTRVLKTFLLSENKPYTASVR
jgi:hypothetical protein